MYPGASPHLKVWNVSDGLRAMGTGQSRDSGLPAVNFTLGGSFLRASPPADHFTAIYYPDAPRYWCLIAIAISGMSWRLKPRCPERYYLLLDKFSNWSLIQGAHAVAQGDFSWLKVVAKSYSQCSHPIAGSWLGWRWRRTLEKDPRNTRILVPQVRRSSNLYPAPE